MYSAEDRRHSSPGFPHSDILGSRPACGSPGLIAASYVLHRLLMPGHSPYTLSSLTILFAPDTHGLLRPIKFSKNGGDRKNCHPRPNRARNEHGKCFGGADWNRTSDPLLAKQVLSQLSYSPVHNRMIVNSESPSATHTGGSVGGPG